MAKAPSEGVIVLVLPMVADATEPPVIAGAVSALFVSVCDPVNVVTVESMDRVLPDFDSPVPAVISPAPENCVNVILFVPITMVVEMAQTQPLPTFAVPVSTKTNAPCNSAEVSASVVRVST